MRTILLSLAILSSAGCIDSQPASGSEAQFQFGGSFTAQATQQQIDEFGQKMRAHGGEALIMESHPAQFRVHRLGASVCPDAREEADSLPYVASVGSCEPIRASGDDEATSTSHS